MFDFIKTLAIVCIVIIGGYGTFILLDVGSWLFSNHEEYYHVMAGTGTMLLAIAAFYTAGIGVREYQYRKAKIDAEIRAAKQDDEKRKFRFELANKIIDLFYLYQKEMQDVRFGGEIEGEDEEVCNLHNQNIEWWDRLSVEAQYGYLGNMRASKMESPKEITSLRPKFRIVFGTDDPMIEFNRLQKRFLLAYIKLTNPSWLAAQLSEDEKREYESVIHYDSRTLIDNTDEFANEIEAMVQKVEEICGPYIAEEYGAESGLNKQ